MTNSKRFTFLVFLNLVIFLILFEIGSVAFYAIENGGFFYTREQDKDALSQKENLKKVSDVLFHPFFGYVHRQNPAWASNAGMGTGNRHPEENCCDLPLIPNKNQMVVAVFGGSVARQFSHVTRGNRLLNDLLSPYPQFKGKEVTVLNFTMSGYRQPQQLMMFAFYVMRGQKIDVAINIDGYNEVYHGALNAERGIDIDLPAEDIWGQMQEFVDQLNIRLDDRSGIQAAYYKWTSRNNRRLAMKCAIASCFTIRMLGEKYYNFLATRSSEEWELDRRKVSHFYRFTPPPQNPGGKNVVRDYSKPDQLYKDIAEYWGESSRMMAEIAERRGILYIHMLQPNLYYPTKRKFEPKNPSHYTPKFSQPVKSGYPYMVKKLEELRKDGILALDVLDIFDDAPEDVGYIDDCCHFNIPALSHWWKYTAKVIGVNYPPKKTPKP